MEDGTTGPEGATSKITVAPFGVWKSPITSSLLSAHSISFAGLATSPSGNAYSVETRSGGGDDGRFAVVEWPFEPGTPSRDVLPAPHSARTKVHGYGGGAIAVDPSTETIIFSDNGVGVWRLDPRARLVDNIVKADPDVYYADFDVRCCGRWILAVREDHRGAKSAADVKNCVVAINRSSGEERQLTRRADFYAHPRFSPDGSKISYVRWFHPDMPWTGTELFVFGWDNESGAKIGRPLYSDGKAGCVSIAQPKWGLGETLFYASDKGGTWQLKSVDFSKGTNFLGRYGAQDIRTDGLEGGDFAEPEWDLGSSTFVQLNSETLLATWTRNARERLVVIGLGHTTQSVKSPRWPLTGIRGNSLKRLNDDEFIVVASTSTSPPSLYRLSLSSMAQTPETIPDPLRSSLSIPIPTAYYSRATHVDIERPPEISKRLRDTCSVVPPESINRNPVLKSMAIRSQHLNYSDAACLPSEGTLSYTYYNVPPKCHAYFLPPMNPNYAAPPDTLPPLIVLTHGGPTSHSGPGLDLRVQFFTSRGFAVALANPVGSSGYGRIYREALNSHWGVSDAADVALVARHITRTLKWADPDRVGTVGGSAGGYVTLQALYAHPDIWRGGVSLYGISDVKRLVAGTHKFESWYALRLLFGTETPEPGKEVMERIYRERSARYHVDKIRAPLLLLQGDIDEIVPLDQAKEMEKAMKEGGKKVKLVVFAEEGHGFIRADSTRQAVREEQAWWVMNLVRGGKEETEVEDRWIWIDESSGDEKKSATG